MRPQLVALSRLVLAPVFAGLLALSMVLTMSPANAQKIRPDYFGMHDQDWTSAPSQKVGSANFTTTGSYWPSIERQKGVFTWDRLDAQVKAAEAIRAKPMAVIGLTPTFWSTDKADPDRTDMPNMRAWKRYVKKLANRYGARLDYQIWPEPNIIQNWTGTMPQLAKLTAAASNIIHRADRRAKVVGPAMTLRLKGQRKTMVKYYKQSVGGKRVHKFLDAIAIDTFPVQKGLPEDAFKLMQQATKSLAKIGVKRVPFWNNEINYGVAGGGATTGTSYPVDLQQSFVARTYLLSAAARMARTYWLGWFSTDTMGVQMADDQGNQLAPGRTYGVVRSWMLGTNFGACKRLRNGVWVCTMKKGKREVRRVYWKPSGSAKVALPKSRRRLETQDGAADTSPPRKVKVNYKPVMVASRR